MTIRVRASLTGEGLVQPIVEGKVSFDGLDLDVQIQRSIDKNSRGMSEGLYDLCEMSLATFLKARLDGSPIIALPAFTGRRFLQPGILCSQASKIRSMADLAGSRVGVMQYWMTSSIWHRGILEEFYGVTQDQMHWVTTGAERLASQTWPEGIQVQRIPVTGGPIALIEDGQVDCVLLPKPPKNASAGVVPFADLVEAQREYFARARIFPIMHLVVMSEDLIQRHPGIVKVLMEGFIRAKSLAARESPIEGLDEQSSKDLFGDDPYSYDIDSSRTSLDAFLRYARRQGLIDRTVGVDDIFATTSPYDVRRS